MAYVEDQQTFISISNTNTSCLARAKISSRRPFLLADERPCNNFSTHIKHVKNSYLDGQCPNKAYFISGQCFKLWVMPIWITWVKVRCLTVCCNQRLGCKVDYMREAPNLQA